MADFQWLIFVIISLPVEFLLHVHYQLCFWATVAAAAAFVSWAAAGLVLLGTLFALLVSWGRRPGPLPRYQGTLDVMLGRSYRASTKTPEMGANNNVSIVNFGGELVIAYRKADSHFASTLARIVVSKASPQDLETWTEVWGYHTGTDDLREMLFFELSGKLFLYYATLAPFKRSFTPRRMNWTSTTDLVSWSAPLEVGRISEITWDVKVRIENGQNIAYKTSYAGSHYAADAVCTVHFERSTDGMNWQPVGNDSAVYSGGVSEVSFAFTPAGDIVAIGRNEDGDSTGFGSQLFFARNGDLGNWIPLRVSMPYRFDSPRLLCMQGDLVLFARYARERYSAIPKWLPFSVQRFGNLLTYSALPKSAAVYHICAPDQGGELWPENPIKLIRCLEECYGDTGFFSLAKGQSDGEWVIANYSSSLCNSHAPWIYGQVFDTDVNVCRCHPIRTG